MADDTDAYVKALQGLSPADQAAMQPETFVNPLVKKKIDDVAGVMAIPGQVLSNQEPSTSESLIPSAVNMTGTFGSMGVPMAESGSAGIFGGKLAQTADLRALSEAQKMRMGGVHPADVRADTGWFRPPTDEKWRFEIPDNDARLRFTPENHSEGDSIIGDAKGLLDHKALYQAYPQLENMPMESTKNSFLFDAGSNKPRATGAYYPKDGTPAHISVEGPNSPQITSTLAHELQHGVQDIEGFASGANPSTYSDLIMKGWRKNPNVIGGNPLANVLNEAYPLYRKTAGEVESRNVQTRRLWTPQMRAQHDPWYSQDIPYGDQIVYDHNAGTIRALRNK